MLATGRVQESGSGQTSVTRPADPRAWSAAALDSVYVEFDVAREALAAGGREDWAVFVGPRSIHARHAIRRGLARPEMPVARNIELVIA